jgi:dATP pyrophosphohydrolase
VRLSAREHTSQIWLPWAQAAERCFSPSNAEAITWLPRLWAERNGASRPSP